MTWSGPIASPSASVRSTGARPVLRPAERQADAQVVGLERAVGHERDRLLRALAGDDVGLPFVRVTSAPLSSLSFASPPRWERWAWVRRMCLRSLRPAPDLPDQLEDAVSVVVEEGVDQRQLLAVLEQIGVDVPTLLLSDAVDAGSDAHPVAVYARLNPAELAGLLVVVGVDLDVVLPLVGQLVLCKAGVHGQASTQAS